MADAAILSPELARSVSTLARALVSAARNWTLYPPDHPAVSAALDRLRRALADAGSTHGFAFGITPDTLLVEGVAAPADGPVAEAAAWLHHRDVLQLAFGADVPPAALNALLSLLGEDVEAVRQRGGPATAWAALGHPSIAIQQIDYSSVLEDREVAAPRPAQGRRVAGDRARCDRPPERLRRDHPAAAARDRRRRRGHRRTGAGGAGARLRAPTARRCSPRRPRPSSPPTATSSASSTVMEPDRPRRGHAEPRRRHLDARPAGRPADDGGARRGHPGPGGGLRRRGRQARAGRRLRRLQGGATAGDHARHRRAGRRPAGGGIRHDRAGRAAQAPDPHADQDAAHGNRLRPGRTVPDALVLDGGAAARLQRAPVRLGAVQDRVGRRGRARRRHGGGRSPGRPRRPGRHARAGQRAAPLGRSLLVDLLALEHDPARAEEVARDVAAARPRTCCWPATTTRR